MNTLTFSPQAQAAPNVSAMPPVIIIADDLTGACDSAAAFLGRAERVRVLLRPSGVAAEAGTVTAFSTETRNVSSAEAVAIIERTPAAIQDRRGNEIVFKKIDSAGRGHVAPETMAALRVWGCALGLVAPAFPSAGRTVSNGVLHVRDSAQQDASVDLAALFDRQCRDLLEVLPLGAEEELERAIQNALGRGGRILLCDAETQADLDRLVRAAYRVAQPILWTGSAGLAFALASRFPATTSPTGADCAWPEGRALVFVGTNHPVTAAQVLHLEQQSAATRRNIHRLEWKDASAEFVRKTFSESPVSALVLTGGDTAAFVLEALNARVIRLVAEFAPGIPWGFIEGGEADGCAIVTKSGGFGQQETLTNILHFCSRRICEPA
jgi:uncharacterized protein YgbK (DUF1537 family)